MSKINEEWNSFNNRQIIDILIGDTNVLPYWSGSKLSGLCTTFGAKTTFGVKFGPSRWNIMQTLLAHCTREYRMSDFLNYFFDEERIKEVEGSTSEEVQEQIQKGISEMNKILSISKNELIRVGERYILHKIGTEIKLETPILNVIDSKYIEGLTRRALLDIANGDFDSALTKSRTLLEEVFCYVIELKHVVPSDKGNIGTLYSQVKNLYNMHQNKETDKRINSLLSGLEKIITAITNMRNDSSDSHGVGTRRISIKDYHARLFVNSSTSMAEFVLSVAKNNS